MLNIKELVNSSQKAYKFAEIGLPKGRRNVKESNLVCAEREFFEETGYDKSCYDFVKNYPVIYEQFMGTNSIRYKHVYYLVRIKDDTPPPTVDMKNIVQSGEVQNIGWLTCNECLGLIRPYDIAKKNVIKKVHEDLLKMKNDIVCSNYYYTSKNNSTYKQTPFKQFSVYNSTF